MRTNRPGLDQLGPRPNYRADRMTRASKKPHQGGTLLSAMQSQSQKLREMHARTREAKELRRSAEDNLAETIRSVVQALEFGLTELMETPTHASSNERVNQKQVVNAIVHLKTKCGVKFDSLTFTRRVKLDGK